MTMRIAINGFGRIGRSVGRILAGRSDVKLVAVNDLAEIEQLAYLFEYDSVHGRFDGPVEVEGQNLVIGEDSVEVYSERDPAALPWDRLDIDVAIESTGQFRKREDAQKHLEAGAGHVLISAPGKEGVDESIVMGVNHEQLDPGETRIFDAASCTTNCLAPVAKVLNDQFGIEHGLMTTVHSYTGSQSLLDGPNPKDFRRGRTAAENMVPTTTGAAVAVTDVIPELDGKLDGMAIRVPTPNVSLIDLNVRLESDVTIQAVNDAFSSAARGQLEGILDVTDEPLVSTDMMTTPASSTVDLASTMLVQDRGVKVISWYDNEWGFSNRLVDLVEYVGHNSQ